MRRNEMTRLFLKLPRNKEKPYLTQGNIQQSFDRLHVNKINQNVTDLTSQSTVESCNFGNENNWQ